MLQRLLWKMLPKTHRRFLLGCLPVEQRQIVNKVLSARAYFPDFFREKHCLFIHVPKCAGTSVCCALFDGGRPGHLPLYWYEQMFPAEYAASFKFTFVRDPLERAYSAYTFLKRNHGSGRDREAYELVSRHANFDGFVSNWLHPENVHKQLHFVPQSTFLCDSTGSLAMDFIGHQERMEEDFRQLCERTGWNAKLPQANRSPDAHMTIREQCTVRTRRLVRRVYERDYHLLGYD
ncbi:MAG TPA: sulfotransferase family 2 domain-containing protein [Pseudomonas sp.]